MKRSISGTRRHTWLGDSGAAALEFAILLPVLLVMIYGFIEGSRMYQARLAMSYAAREGARVLAVGTHDSGAAQAAVVSRAYPLSAGRLSVATSVDEAAEIARVTVSYAYEPLLLPDMNWTIPPITVEMRAE